MLFIQVNGACVQRSENEEESKVVATASDAAIENVEAVEVGVAVENRDAVQVDAAVKNRGSVEIADAVNNSGLTGFSPGSIGTSEDRLNEMREFQRVPKLPISLKKVDSHQMKLRHK